MEDNSDIESVEQPVKKSPFGTRKPRESVAEAASLAHVRLKVLYYNNLSKASPSGPTGKMPTCSTAAQQSGLSSPLPTTSPPRASHEKVISHPPPVKAARDYTAVFGRLNLGYDTSPRPPPPTHLSTLVEENSSDLDIPAISMNAILPCSSPTIGVTASMQELSIEDDKLEGERLVRAEGKVSPAAPLESGQTKELTALAALEVMVVPRKSLTTAARESVEEEVLFDFRPIKQASITCVQPVAGSKTPKPPTPVLVSNCMGVLHVVLRDCCNG